MHFATVSGGIPSARKLLATDSAFSAAPSARPSSRPSARPSSRPSERPSERHPGLQVLQRHPPVAKGVFRPVFGTATLATGTSGASMLGETVWNRCQIGFLLMPRPVFGTAPQSTGTPEPSPRGEGVFWPVFGTATPPTGTSVPSSRGEPVIYRHFGRI